MDISVSQESNQLVFTLGGTIDEKGAGELKERFSQAYKPEMKTIIFNFGRVTHIGSAGIGKLLLFYKKVGLNGGAIVIERPDKTVAELLYTLKLDAVFTIKKD